MKWYNIINKADKAEIWIYEMIGEDFWSGDGITAKKFQEDLSRIKSSQIDLHINSPGGEVFDGLTIYNLLKQHPANVTTYIDGLAASIASVIALSGNKVYMAENALFMTHNPLMLTIGNESDHQKSIDLLKTVRNSISKAYINKTGKEEKEIFSIMDEETWMDADAAIEFGFVDEITDKIDMAACAKFVPVMSKAGFKNIPDELNLDQVPTAKDADKALRNAGFSRKQTKIILAKGISEYLRNVDSGQDDSLRNAEGFQDDSGKEDASLRNVDAPKPKKDLTADLLNKAKLKIIEGVK